MEDNPRYSIEFERVSAVRGLMRSLLHGGYVSAIDWTFYHVKEKRHGIGELSSDALNLIRRKAHETVRNAQRLFPQVVALPLTYYQGRDF